MMPLEVVQNVFKLNNNILYLGKGNRDKGLSVIKTQYAPAYKRLTNEIVEAAFPVIWEQAAVREENGNVPSEEFKTIQGKYHPLLTASLIETCDLDEIDYLTKAMRLELCEVRNRSHNGKEVIS